MWCFVSQPNSVVLEVEVDPKADGQECLDKVCQQLGIIEVDYFGLQFQGNRGEKLWLNLRNRIDTQLTGPLPYRFQLRVKFFVQPHLLLQETTRHQFYLNVKQEVQMGRLKPENPERLAALISQADFGDSDRANLTNQHAVYKNLLPEEATASVSDEDFVQAVWREHVSLRGVSRESSEYRFLSETSRLCKYGVEDHVARSMTAANITIHIGVGPEGILLHSEDTNETQRIEYPMIQTATNTGKCLFLTVPDTMSGEGTVMGFRLVTQKAAHALYRCVTEMHSFYKCDTVRNAVSAQFCRDLKGTIFSIFNENTSLGKKYIFDIRRTCREVYDHARRRLYADSLRSQPQDGGECENGHAQETSGSHGFGGDDPESHQQCSCHNKCLEWKEKLRSLRDALMCRVCMDADINTALCPCGHMVCCSSCVRQLHHCPLCRSAIDRVQQVYPPLITDNGAMGEQQVNFHAVVVANSQDDDRMLHDSGASVELEEFSLGGAAISMHE